MADDLRPDPETPDGPVVREEDDHLAVSDGPRRTASAEFTVASEVGSEAQLRAAMDPANQSLRDALRLSFRVLQVVIVGLIVVFIFSGVARVEEGQSGVMLRFGRIVGEPGQQALEPGPVFSALPYPAGEFLLFQDRNRDVTLSREFWPEIRSGRSFDQEVEAARTNTLLRPGPTRDQRGTGYVLTANGDIAHAQLRAVFEIPDPVQFVETLSDGPDGTTLPADGAVRLALMRATVHTAAAIALDDFTEFTDVERDAIRRTAQSSLDDLGTGLRIAELATVSDPVPAFAIVKASRDLQETIRLNDEALERARQQAESQLIQTAGETLRELLDLIDSYRVASVSGDEAAADAALAAVDAALEDTAKAGEIAGIIEQARSHRSFIEATLGQRYRQYVGLLDAYRRNPQFVVDRAWARTYSTLLDPRDTEIIRVPPGTQSFTMHLKGNEEVARRRRDADIAQDETRAIRETFGSFEAGPSARDMQRQLDRKAGRQLNRDGTPFDR